MTDDDETFQYLRRRTPEPRSGNDTLVVGASLTTVTAVALFVIAFVLDLPTEVQIVPLAVAFLAFLVAFRRYFAGSYAQVEVAETRREFPAEPEDVTDMVPLTRRRLLTRALAAAAAALGLAAVVPLASLGPRYRPPTSGWGAGVRLVTALGEPIQPDELEPAGVAMVWPEGALREEHGTVMLVRLVVEPQTPTRLDWVVDDGVVAYSRVCTHAGCSIGIFRESDSALYCPCHQAQFDLRRGATPIFGPASRPLPQLPLGVDDDGYLVALGDFTEPVGPPRG